MLDHERTRVVEQDFFSHSAKRSERAFQSIEPALLPLVAERLHMQPTRVAERGDKQIHTHTLAADQRTPLAKIDLQLLARRCLEPDRRPSLRLQLAPQRCHLPLDRSQAKGLSLNNRIGRIESGWRQRRNERIHKGE